MDRNIATIATIATMGVGVVDMVVMVVMLQASGERIMTLLLTPID